MLDCDWSSDVCSSDLEALDWLSHHLALIYEKEGGRLFRDPWRARDSYIQVMLNRSEDSVARFMAEELAVSDVPETRIKALQLLEMQRHAMLMYTSCGWFFSDISGIEAVQNLQYAARAVELARQAAGANLEGGLAARLRLAPSNFPEHGDGERVYRGLALRGKVTEDLAVAHHGVSLLFSKEGESWSIGNFQIVDSSVQRRRGEAGAVAAGRVALRFGTTGQIKTRLFLGVARPGFNVSVYIRPDDVTEAQVAQLLERVAAWSGSEEPQPEILAGGLFPWTALGFDDLPADERERILNILMEMRRELGPATTFAQLQECISLAEQHWRLGLEQPVGLRGQAEAALDVWLHRRARDFAAGDEAALSGVGALVARARAAGLNAPSISAEEAWGRCFSLVLDGLEERFDSAGLRRLSGLARAAAEMGLREWRFRTQNRFYSLLRLHAEDDVLLVGEVDEAARLLDIALDDNDPVAQPAGIVK
jgi:hypothetical protein